MINSRQCLKSGVRSQMQQAEENHNGTRTDDEIIFIDEVRKWRFKCGGESIGKCRVLVTGFERDLNGSGSSPRRRYLTKSASRRLMKSPRPRSPETRPATFSDGAPARPFFHARIPASSSSATSPTPRRSTKSTAARRSSTPSSSPSFAHLPPLWRVWRA